MGTRGFIGFAVDGREIITYNHFDSYPQGLGVAMLDWLHRTEIEAARGAARKLRLVTDETPPTDQDIERLSSSYDAHVDGVRERPSWYQLLRGTQGDPVAVLNAGIVEDSSDFPADSLFAEWGYVVDFDAGAFEVYEGFQTQPHEEGRFASKEPVHDGYYPVRLIASWPLSKLPSIANFLMELSFEDAYHSPGAA